MNLKTIDSVDYLLSRLETNEYFDIHIPWARRSPEQWVEFFSVIALRIIKTENILDSNWAPIIDSNTWKIRQKITDEYYQHFILLKNLRERINKVLWEDSNFSAFDLKEGPQENLEGDTYNYKYNEVVSLYKEKFSSVDTFKYLWEDIGWIASIAEKEPPYQAYHIKLDGTPLYSARFKTVRNFEWDWKAYFSYIPKEKLGHGLWVVWVWSPLRGYPLAWWKTEFEEYFARAITFDGQYVTIDTQGEIVQYI